MMKPAPSPEPLPSGCTVCIQSCRLRQLACSDETILVVQNGKDRAMHIVNVQNLHFPCRALTPDKDVESVFPMNQSRNETVPGKRR